MNLRDEVVASVQRNITRGEVAAALRTVAEIYRARPELYNFYAGCEGSRGIDGGHPESGCPLLMLSDTLSLGMDFNDTCHQVFHTYHLDWWNHVMEFTGREVNDRTKLLGTEAADILTNYSYRYEAGLYN